MILVWFVVSLSLILPFFPCRSPSVCVHFVLEQKSFESSAVETVIAKRATVCVIFCIEIFGVRQPTIRLFLVDFQNAKKRKIWKITDKEINLKVFPFGATIFIYLIRVQPSIGTRPIKVLLCQSLALLRVPKNKRNSHCVSVLILENAIVPYISFRFFSFYPTLSRLRELTLSFHTI